MRTVQQLGQEAYEALEMRKRDDGSTYWAFKDGRPDWMQELAHEAHGDMMPDDWRYRFITEAIAVIAEADEDMDGDDFRELFDEHFEPDIYTSTLTDWLNSNVARTGHCDEVLAELGGDLDSIFKIIALGQADQETVEATQ